MSKQPHKHADFIKAWADGATIQWRTNDPKDCEWREIYCNYPFWLPYCEYRVKPEPKPDYKVPMGIHKLEGGGWYLSRYNDQDNINLIYDGETHKLKGVELIND